MQARSYKQSIYSTYILTLEVLSKKHQSLEQSSESILEE